VKIFTATVVGVLGVLALGLNLEAAPRGCRSRFAPEWQPRPKRGPLQARWSRLETGIGGPCWFKENVVGPGP
jgi:hypothetical protein